MTKRQSNATLYQRALGESFGQLHPTLQTFHGAEQGATATGIFTVERGKSWRSWLCSLMGLPPAAEAVAIRLSTKLEGNQEQWLRFFDEHPMHSTISLQNNLLLERSGLITLGLELSVVGENLRFESRKVWWFGIRIPSWFAPQVMVTTQADQDGWVLETIIQMKGIGVLIRYHGTMKMEQHHA